MFKDNLTYLAMENVEERSPEAPVNLIVTEEIRSYLYETSKWTRFLSIVGFVIAVLLIVFAFSMGAIMNSTALSNPGFAAFGRLGGTLVTVILLLYALLIFYPSFLLFKFSNTAQQAVLYSDQSALTAAAVKLKSYFKFFGILTIVGIAFYAISILLVMLGMMGN